MPFDVHVYIYLCSNMYIANFQRYSDRLLQFWVGNTKDIRRRGRYTGNAL